MEITYHRRASRRNARKRTRSATGIGRKIDEATWPIGRPSKASAQLEHGLEGAHDRPARRQRRAAKQLEREGTDVEEWSDARCEMEEGIDAIGTEAEPARQDDAHRDTSPSVEPRANPNSQSSVAKNVPNEPPTTVSRPPTNVVRAVLT